MVEHQKPVVELEEVVLDLNYPDRMVRICVGLTESIKKVVVHVLRDYKEIFVYGLEDMLRDSSPWVKRGSEVPRLAGQRGAGAQAASVANLVDKTAGCALLSFMDAFRGYHEGYCYKVMPFGSKNLGATYMHMVVRLFKSLIGKSMAAFVDDMLVKSKEEEEHVKGLANCFRIMR
nr:uncharacterized protein LOC109189889 [Ipomoea batatas]